MRNKTLEKNNRHLSFIAGLVISWWQSPLVWCLPTWHTTSSFFANQPQHYHSSLCSHYPEILRVMPWGMFTVYKYHKKHWIQSHFNSSFSWQSEIAKAVHMTSGWKLKGRGQKTLVNVGSSYSRTTGAPIATFSNNRQGVC